MVALVFLRSVPAIRNVEWHSFCSIDYSYRTTMAPCVVNSARRRYSSHVCGGMHLHLPPTILAMNGFAGSFAVCSISGQLAGSQK